MYLGQLIPVSFFLVFWNRTFRQRSKKECRYYRASEGEASLVKCYSNHIITRISIQTAGLAFSGTVLCSFHVRSIDSSCAEYLTVESYTVIICQQSYLLFGIPSPSPTHSFIPGLKPSFSANPFHRSPSFFFFRIHYMDSPNCLLLLLSISVFTF